MPDDQSMGEAEIVAMFERAYDEAMAGREGGVSTLSVDQIPDPRVLCRLYQGNEAAVCAWLKGRLGDKAGSVLCWTLSFLCGN
jgi:hypothetical protein